MNTRRALLLWGSPLFLSGDPARGKMSVIPAIFLPNGQEASGVTVLCRFGVLLPDVGLTDPDVSSSSAEDQEDKSYMGNRFLACQQDSVLSLSFPKHKTPTPGILPLAKSNSFLENRMGVNSSHDWALCSGLAITVPLAAF